MQNLDANMFEPTDLSRSVYSIDGIRKVLHEISLILKIIDILEHGITNNLIPKDIS
jgi:hypothetical protein